MSSGERRRKAAEVLVGVVLVGADGEPRPLLDFSLDDVRHFWGRARQLSKSWKTARKFFEQVEGLLVETGAERVSDLPAGQVEQVAALALTVWKSRRYRRRP